jgi:hypothetical protein
MNDKLKRIRELISDIDPPEPTPDDWNAYDQYGGNMDDAFAGGIEEGRRQFADEIKQILSE